MLDAELADMRSEAVSRLISRVRGCSWTWGHCVCSGTCWLSGALLPRNRDCSLLLVLGIATSTGRRQLPRGNPGPLAWGQQGSVPLGVSWDLWLLPSHGLSPGWLVLEKHVSSGVFGVLSAC